MPPLHSLFSLGQLTADPQLQGSISTQESPGALVCRINFNEKETMNSLESSLGSRSLANIVYSEPCQLGLTPFCKRTRRAQRHKDPAFRCPKDTPQRGTKPLLARGGVTAGHFKELKLMSLHTLSLREYGSCLQSKAALVIKKKNKSPALPGLYSGFNYKWAPAL